MKTNRYMKTSIPYTAVNRVGEKKSFLYIYGVDDVIFITTDCNGKVYEKMVFYKPLKSKTDDENLQIAMDKWIAKITSWMKPKMNGRDFYNHDIKTDRYLEMDFEQILYGEE